MYILYFTLGTFKVVGNGIICWIVFDFLIFIIVNLALSSTVLVFDLDEYCNLDIRARGRSRSPKVHNWYHSIVCLWFPILQ